MAGWLQDRNMVEGPGGEKLLTHGSWEVEKWGRPREEMDQGPDMVPMVLPA